MAAAQYRPHTLVWAPIPLLTWLYPPIGHLGICLSDGVILDFAGSGMVGHVDLYFVLTKINQK